MYIIPYSMYSQSAKLLRDTGFTLIKNHKRQLTRRGLVTYWGYVPQVECVGCNIILNIPDKVKKVVNKISFFESAKDFEWCVPFTTDENVAKAWLNDDHTVFSRSSPNGTGGKDITILTKDTPFVKGKFYTQYKKKKKEFRVHVLPNGSIEVQQKVARAANPPKNFLVRSHDNGFIFQRNGIQVPECVVKVATEAVSHFGLDFGGVDVIWNEHEDKAYVLEINSAPGIEGQTVQTYFNSFLQRQMMG
jgi:hypothetical protein